ncbi:MAG TPA: response regulator transcription factor [Anaerolineales bacterium]|nr:response regulator transcription factor [Anaerolineales bacterium]
MNPIRLMLVDDHDIVRTGLKAFLETQEGIQVVAEAGSGIEALQRVEQAQPDVVVMDITMPSMDGLEATRRLKQIAPACKVLALTVHEDKQYLFEMLLAGATGYITKQVAADELVTAIRSVAVGNVYLQPALARWLLEDYRRLFSEQPVDEFTRPRSTPGSGQPLAKSLDVLSHRERQVLEAVAEGLTNQQIGERLGISPKTVARHRERVMNKLNLHSSTELVKFAIRSGLIRLED